MTLRIDRLQANGWGPLRDVDLDLAGLSGITAIAGPNGAGKSTALELIPAALYRETPSRGPLAKIATVKGATLELQAHNSVPIMVRHVVDATTKTPRQESILRVGDQPPTSGKVKDFDEAAARVFPPPEFYLASAFSAQGGMGAFADLSRDERRQVLQRLLGLERLQSIADVARDRRKTVEAEVASLERRVAELGAGVPACLEEELKQAHANLEADARYVEDLEGRIAVARRDVATAEAALAAVDQARAEWAKRRDRLASLAIEHSNAETAVQRSEMNRGVAEQIERQIAEAERIGEALAEIAPGIGDLKAELGILVEQGRANRAEVKGLEQDLASVNTLLTRWDEIRAAQERETDLVNLLASADASVPMKEAVVTAAQGRVTAHERAASELRQAEERLVRARRDTEDLAGVPCAGQGEYSGCRFLARAIEARQAITGIEAGIESARALLDPGAPSDLQQAQQALRDARARQDCLRAELDAARALAADACRLEDAKERWDRIHARLAVLNEQIVPLREQHASLETRLRELTQRQAQLQKELSVKCPAGERLAREKAAAARADAEQLDERRTRLYAIATEIQDLGELGQEPSPIVARERVRETKIAASKIEDEIKEVRRRREETISRVAQLDAKAARAREDAEQRTVLEADRDRLLQVAADWDLIEQGFSKDGIQALLIDAAGPAISKLCNQLLEVTFGSRFRVSLETTRSSADGKKLIETLDLRVIDNERGREGSIETLSGGERVVVGLALRLALCLHHGAGAGFSQLFLDEMDGALDSENAERFVPLLRRAMDLGGLTQIVFVSHREACQAAADHVIRVENGRVRVER